MALSFNGIEPVNFGGKDCTPRINTELRLRLTDLKQYNEEADEVLASAFPNDESYVLSFLRDKMTILDKQTLHAYLIGGPSMVEALKDQMKGAMKNA